MDSGLLSFYNLIDRGISPDGTFDFNKFSDTEINDIADGLAKYGSYSYSEPWQNTGITNNNSSWLNNVFGGNGMSNLISGLGVLGGIGSGILSYINGNKMMNLANDQFDFQKALANRNLANQAKIINNQYDSSAQVAAAMAGSGGRTSQDTIRRYEDNARKKYVNGSWIG